MEISKEAVSGNGTLEQVGIKLDGKMKCPHCTSSSSAPRRSPSRSTPLATESDGVGRNTASSDPERWPAWTTCRAGNFLEPCAGCCSGPEGGCAEAAMSLL